MGFSRDQAEVALAACNGSPKEAIEILLSNQPPPDGKDIQKPRKKNKRASDSENQLKKSRRTTQKSSTASSSSSPSSSRAVAARSYVEIQETPEMTRVVDSLFSSVRSNNREGLESALRSLSRLPDKDAKSVRSFATRKDQNVTRGLLEEAVAKAPLVAFRKEDEEPAGNFVPALLNAGFDPNYCDGGPLTSAAFAGNEDIVKHLLEAKASPHQGSGNAVCRAARCLFMYSKATTAFEKVISRLAEAKADVNASDGSGKTALMIASGFGFTKVVKMLIQCNADVDFQCSRGLTAMHEACVGYKGSKRNRESCLKALLKARASTDCRTTRSFQGFPPGAQMDTPPLRTCPMIGCQRAAVSNLRMKLSGTRAVDMAKSRGISPSVVRSLAS